MLPELLGDCGCGRLSELTEEELGLILTEPPDSVWREYRELFIRNNRPAVDRGRSRALVGEPGGGDWAPRLTVLLEEILAIYPFMPGTRRSDDHGGRGLCGAAFGMNCIWAAVALTPRRVSP
jgi:hypothetical protein